MLSRRTNSNQGNRIGSKTNPIGSIFKTKQVGKSDEDIDILTSEEVEEMIELEITEVPLSCLCATTPIGTVYKNLPNLADALNYIDKDSHDKLIRYHELKERQK